MENLNLGDYIKITKMQNKNMKKCEGLTGMVTKDQTIIDGKSVWVNAIRLEKNNIIARNILWLDEISSLDVLEKIEDRIKECTILTYTSSIGELTNARIVKYGERYGRDWILKFNKEEYSKDYGYFIEFHNASATSDKSIGDNKWSCIRYFISTFMKSTGINTGVKINGKTWGISGEELNSLKEWITKSVDAELLKKWTV